MKKTDYINKFNALFEADADDYEIDELIEECADDDTLTHAEYTDIYAYVSKKYKELLF